MTKQQLARMRHLEKIEDAGFLAKAEKAELNQLHYIWWSLPDEKRGIVDATVEEGWGG